MVFRVLLERNIWPSWESYHIGALTPPLLTFVAKPNISSGITRLPLTALITRTVFSIRAQIESCEEKEFPLGTRDVIRGAQE